MNKKKYLFLIFLSILTPYVLTVFFVRSSSLLIILPSDIIALIILIISTIKYLKTVDSRKHKMITRFSVFGMVILYFVSYGFLLQTADYVFFKLREKRLNEFVVDIKDYNKINAMSDGQGFWKTLNDYSIEPDITNVDTTKKYGKKYHLDDILTKEQIEIDKYEEFRQILIDVDLISFTTLRDGTISFTIDGFLDNCQGFAYSETDENPGGNDCGRIIHWRKVAKNWYAWYTT